MLKIIDNPDLEKYRATYSIGEPLFLEGDSSRDLFVLVSGTLDVLKGDKKISELNESGTLFGEMSFLLGEQRTASIKAKDSVEVVRFPGEKIEELMTEVPSMAQEISVILAERLRDTSSMVHGLKEFCDQLPDAVMITTDKDQRILAWNSAAERLYGREANEMRNLPLGEIYEDPDAYQEFQSELQTKKSLSGKTMRVKNPAGDQRFVSTSTTVLYDGHRNVQGLLFLGRDVTKIHAIERKYVQIRNWLFPAIALLGICLAVFSWAYPNFTRGSQILGYKIQSFQDRVGKDYTVLAQKFAAASVVGDQAAMAAVMEAYFAGKDPDSFGITGLLLLDRDKKVIAAYSPKQIGETSGLLNSSYGAIQFSENEKSPHYVLKLFRSTKEHPMGTEGLELAFSIPGGLLVFQLDPEWIGKEFGIDGKTLKKMRF